MGNMSGGVMTGAPARGGLHVEGVRKAYGRQPVLLGVDVAAPPGAVLALLGASGSGKTTLLRLLAGFERADAGRITLEGRVLDQPGLHIQAERRRVGYVPQEGTLFPHLSAARNIAFGLGRAERRAGVVEQVMALTGLSGLGDRYPHQLSGGQQQRTALARALAPRPGLILLDEPFAALDLSLRRQVGEDVTSLLRANGTTAVLVTHDPEEAFACADLVAVMAGGVVAQCDAPMTVYRQPASAAVARLTGSVLELEAEFHGDSASTVLGPVALACAAAPGRGRVVLRPEQVRRVPAGHGVAARLLGVRFRGTHQMVAVQVQGITMDIAMSGMDQPEDAMAIAVQGACLPV